MLKYIDQYVNTYNLYLYIYYRWFVKDFAKIAIPLHEITRKEIK